MVEPRVDQIFDSIVNPQPKTAASEKVANYLRQRIVRGELLAGQKVPQNEIAAHLGVSRMPVREALQQLDAQGFVRLQLNRGAVVRELSIQDIREVYQIRIALEGLAARLAALKTTSEQLNRLRQLVLLMRTAAHNDEIFELLDLNSQFHHTCYESAGNARLLKMVADLRDYSLRYRVFHAHIPHRLHESLQEHEAILQALEARSGDLAERHTVSNMQRTADILINHLEKYWGSHPTLAALSSSRI